jgi:hypothetical protein
MTCPGSFRVSQAVTEPAGSSRWAAQGTVAHAVAEELILNGGPIDQALGQTRYHDGHDILVDQEMVEAVEIYINAVQPIISEADFCSTEQQVSLNDYFYPANVPVALFGTCDLLAYARPPRRLSIVDYKHGAGVYVGHIDNAQMLYYAAGALAWLKAHHPDTDPLEVEMIIVQPRVPGHEPVRRYVLPVIDILLWVETELKPAVAETQRDDAVLVMGDHCRWCPGRIICPAMQAARVRNAQRSFGAIADDSLTDATDQDIADYLDDAERLEIWISATREEAQRRLEDGARIPGWGLVPTRPMRAWGDESAVYVALLKAGATADQIYENPKMRSPAQMEKHVPSAAWRKVQPLIDVRSSGVKIARSLTPAQPFDAVPDHTEKTHG